MHPRCFIHVSLHWMKASAAIKANLPCCSIAFRDAYSLHLWTPRALYLYAQTLRSFPTKGFLPIGSLLLLHVAVNRLSHVLCCRHGGDDIDNIRGVDCWWKAKEGSRVEDSDWPARFGGTDTVHCYGSGGEFFSFLLRIPNAGTNSRCGQIFNVS